MRFYTKIKMRVFLIRKRIFRFFTKIQKRTIDPIDPQRRWILWIISKTRYFGYMIRRVSLLRIRKECGNSKPFKYIHVHQLFDRTHLSLRSFLNRSHGLNDGSYPFYRVSKMAIQTGPALFKLQGKNATILRRRVLQDFIFPLPASTYLISRLVLILARLKQYPKANRP